MYGPLERAPPHRIVGVHAFGEDACELIHFGTTLVQGGKPLSDILAVCYAAVTYHELFKIAALDATARIEELGWRALYRSLDYQGDGDLDQPQVRARLLALGSDEADADEVLRALFRSQGSVEIDDFVARASRLQSPLKLDL